MVCLCRLKICEVLECTWLKIHYMPFSRVVLSEAVDWCICFTRKIQHGGDWERSRPQGPKNVHNFLMTVRPLSSACGHGSEMLLILKKTFLTWLCPHIFWYDSPKKCPTILYAVNLWLKPVSATGANMPFRCYAPFLFKQNVSLHESCFKHVLC